MGLGIWAPASYLLFLTGSLYLFSKVYRKKQAASAAAVFVPYFPQHKSRDIYVSLLSLPITPPRPILIAALLRRAMDDVHLIWSMRDSKAALTSLLAKGQIGDDLWERFLLAEKELEVEIVEVVQEAETWETGYGSKIFATASDMVMHERWKKVYSGLATKRLEEAKKQALGAPGSLYAPLTHLSPSTLTLFPSNPVDTSIPLPTITIDAVPLPAARAALAAAAAVAAASPKIGSPAAPSSQHTTLSNIPSVPSPTIPVPISSDAPVVGANPTPLRVALSPSTSTPSSPALASSSSSRSPVPGSASARSSKLKPVVLLTPAALAAEEADEGDDEAEARRGGGPSSSRSGSSTPGTPASSIGSLSPVIGSSTGAGGGGGAGSKKNKKKRKKASASVAAAGASLHEVVEDISVADPL